MSTYTLALIFGALAVPALLGMWLGWRSRARRDASVLTPVAALQGPLLARFAHASYVSTTRAGAPLERVALPGLQYKGYADVEVRTDGVAISVTGAEPITIPATDVIDTATARGRIGKAVERDGLSILRWRPSGPTATDMPDGLESSFRFPDPVDQRRFADAIAQLEPAHMTSTIHPTTQEDA